MPVYLGETYGRLTTIALVGRAPRRWLCSCSCGNPFVVVRADCLITGNTRTCGCSRTGRRRGESTSPTYVTWAAMRRRCSDPRHPKYSNYGGRGIRVCPRWTDRTTGYDAFVEDMGRRPPGLTIDRVDGDGDYEPSNCRWADTSTQRWNRRSFAERDDGERAHWDALEAQFLAQK